MDCLALWKTHKVWKVLHTSLNSIKLGEGPTLEVKITVMLTHLPLYVILLAWMRLTSERNASRFWYLCLEMFCWNTKIQRGIFSVKVLCFADVKNVRWVYMFQGLHLAWLSPYGCSPDPWGLWSLYNNQAQTFCWQDGETAMTIVKGRIKEWEADH